AENWFGRVARPGATALVDNQASRTEDQFSLNLYPFCDSGGHYGWDTAGDTLDTKLFSGAQLLKETATAPLGAFPALPTPATYRPGVQRKAAQPRAPLPAKTKPQGALRLGPPRRERGGEPGTRSGRLRPAAGQPQPGTRPERLHVPDRRRPRARRRRPGHEDR